MGHFRKIGLAVAADQHSIQFNWFYSHFTEDTLKINIYSYYWTTSRILLLVQIVASVTVDAAIMVSVVIGTASVYIILISVAVVVDVISTAIWWW